MVFVQTNQIESLGDCLYEVPSGTVPGKTYVVDLRDHSCSCPGYQYRGRCKHLRKVEAQEQSNPTTETRIILIG